MKDINLIRKIAWSFHKSTGLDWNDLFQEAFIAYNKGLRSYDPTRGALSTHMWIFITSELKNYVMKELRHTEPLDPLDVVQIQTYPSTFFETLSKEAQEIAAIIQEAADLLVCMDPLAARQRVRGLMFEQGWTLEKVRKGIRDLKIACNNK